MGGQYSTIYKLLDLTERNVVRIFMIKCHRKKYKISYL